MLIQQIDEDLKKAILEKNEEVSLVLRSLKSAIHNEEIKKRPNKLTEEDIQAVVAKEIKSRKDSIVEFEKGNRPDLVEREKKQIEILNKYLPPQMSEEELIALVKQSITEIGATSIADMGKVMGKLMPQVKGKADGSLVAEIVKRELGG